jgi:hypothetical protein
MKILQITLTDDEYAALGSAAQAMVVPVAAADLDDHLTDRFRSAVIVPVLNQYKQQQTQDTLAIVAADPILLEQVQALVAAKTPQPAPVAIIVP